MTQKRYTEIPKRQKCINKEEPYIGGAKDIFDDELGKPQSQVNQEEIANLAAEVERAQQAEGVLDGKVATEKQRAEGVEGGLNTRLQTVEALAEISVGGGDIGIGTAADFESDDPEDLAKVPTISAMLGGTNDGVYDISARHSGATYADLSAALGTNGANIPQSLRKGGMSVKFVQSSDNNYKRFNLIADEFTTVGSFWQEVYYKVQDNLLSLSSKDQLSAKQGTLLSNKGFSFISRANISIADTNDGSTITIGSGNMYVIDKINRLTTINHSSSETFTLTGSACLVYKNNSFQVVSSFASIDDESVVLAIRDGQLNKVCAGILYNFYCGRNLDAISGNVYKLSSDAQIIDFKKSITYDGNLYVLYNQVAISQYFVAGNKYTLQFAGENIKSIEIVFYNSSASSHRYIYNSNQEIVNFVVPSTATSFSIYVYRDDSSSSIVINYSLLKKNFESMQIGKLTINTSPFTFLSQRDIDDFEPNSKYEAYYNGTNISFIQVVFYLSGGRPNVIYTLTSAMEICTIDIPEYATKYSVYMYALDTNSSITIYDFSIKKKNGNVLLGTIVNGNPVVEGYFQNEIEDTINKITAHTSKPCLVSAILSDNHLQTDVQGVRRTNENLMNLMYLNKNIYLDNITHLGDIIMPSEWNNGITSDLQIKKYLQSYINHLLEANINLYATPGNHDGQNLQAFNEEWWYGIYGRINNPNIHADGVYPYFYVDYEKCNTRCVYFPTFDNVGNNRIVQGYSTRMLQWLIEVLVNTPTNYAVIIFSHVPPFMASYVATGYEGVEENGVLANKALFYSICNAFNNHSSGSGTSYDDTELTYNFTTGNSKIVAYICGHVHGEKITLAGETWTGTAVISGSDVSWNFSNGLPCPVICMPSANVSLNGNGYEGTTDNTKVDKTYTQECWDAMVFVPSDKKIYFVRFGAGDDREVDISNII